MDTYKLEDFKNDYPGQSFPEFRKIAAEEGENFRRVFANRLHLPEDATPVSVINKLETLSEPVGKVRLQDFDLATLIDSLNVQLDADDFVYLDWMRFDDIDQIRLTDLSKYFYDIWYGEDFSLFASNCNWMVFVFHYKVVALVKLEVRKPV